MSNFPDVSTVLARLAELQRTTAPITLTIGGIGRDGTVLHDVVIVRNAPPVVVSAVVKEFPFVGLTDDGLRIDCAEAAAALAADDDRMDEGCRSEYVTGGHDPYSTFCDQSQGHKGPHQGSDPFGSDSVIEWRGGGTVGGDRMPCRHVRIVSAVEA